MESKVRLECYWLTTLELDPNYFVQVKYWDQMKDTGEGEGRSDPEELRCTGFVQEK